ncbi:metallophosphoesterase [Mesobacillus jeotgali]|uniref:metallophosphoesterase n=1 Tax=Mesobacillus jeotgali TaxID=129985 RepID=UPI0009A66AFA|nr:metallophosphoesterase [Mesobacillus jeotgali]
MIIFVSDLHLMDGTAGKHQLEVELFKDTFEELGRQAYAAISHLPEKDQDIKIVLLGDIFDVIRTERWFLEKNKNKQIKGPLKERPWGNSGDKKTELIALDILGNIIKKNKEILSILSGREWQNLGFPKKPEVIYIPGNHDRLCNVYPSMRKLVSEELDIKGSAYHYPFQNYYLNLEHGLFARHGHEWDPFNFEGDHLNVQSYNQIPIGDVIAAEIASKLPIVVEKKLKEINLPEEDINQICNNFRNLFDVRPMSAIVPWLSYQVKRYDQYGIIVQNAINAAFRQVGEEFMDIPFVKGWIKKHDRFWNPLDNGDKVQLLGSLLKTFDITNAEWKLKLFDLWDSLKEQWTDNRYVAGAKKDLQALPLNIQYVLYGHTHDPYKQTIDIINGRKQSSQKERTYLNTGTWRPGYQQSLSETGFSKWNNLTYTIIYKQGEIFAGSPVKNPVFEYWTGTINK